MSEGTYLGTRLKKIAEDVGVNGELHGSSEMNLVIYILEAMKRQQDARDKILPMSSTRYRIQKLEQLAERLTPQTLDSLLNLINPSFPFINSAQVVNEASEAPSVFEKPGFSADVTQAKLLQTLDAITTQTVGARDKLAELTHVPGNKGRCPACDARDKLATLLNEIELIRSSLTRRYTGEPS